MTIVPLLAPVLLAAQVQTADVQPPERYRTLARDLLRELVEINTTQSEGDTHAAALAMARRLLDAGFPAEDVRVFEIAPRKGNLVARYRGTNANLPPILLLAHIDVVEADPEDWTLPPFTFTEQGDTFYGRGVADDKDEAAIHVANLIRMREEGYVPVRDIIVALTADEEGGPDNGVQWLLDHHRPLIEAAYALNEGGGGSLLDGIRVSNNVQASEKKYLSFRLETTNPGGHSSLPRPDNAIYAMAQALLRIAGYEFPVRLNEVTREYFRRSADIVEPRMARAMRAIVADPGDADAAAVLAEEPAYRSRLRTTCVATMLEAGHAENALPQRASAVVNCRLLPDATQSRIRQTLVRVIDNPDVTVTAMNQAVDSPPSPLAPEVLGTIEAVTESMWPGVPVIPTMSTGATDGLYLRNAGIPVYGVSGLFYGDTYSHGMNERIPTRAFYEGQEFLYRLVRALTADDIS